MPKAGRRSTLPLMGTVWPPPVIDPLPVEKLKRMM
jgi:hypothetical protein